MPGPQPQLAAKGSARVATVFALSTAVVLATLFINVQCFRSSVKLRVALVAGPRKLNNSSRAAASTPAGVAERPLAEARGLLFFSPSLDVVEDLFPELKACALTKHAALCNAALASHPNRTDDVSLASLVVFPAYLALDENWPLYGYHGYSAPGGANMARHGRPCGAEAVAAARRFLALLRSLRPREGLWAAGNSSALPKLLLLDLNPWGSQVKLEGQTPVPAEAYSDPDILWAKLEHLHSRWRPRLDISFPPPKHKDLFRVPPAGEEPVDDFAPRPSYKHLVSFVGRFSTNPVRAQVAAALNTTARALIVDSGELLADANFTEILLNSAFSLVLPGHAVWSYRFTEVVCSGTSVPVVVASDDWVIPFSPTIPFEEYGLLVSASRIADLPAILQAVSHEQQQRMARRAKMVCKRFMGSVERAVHTVLGLALANLAEGAARASGG